LISSWGIDARERENRTVAIFCKFAANSEPFNKNLQKSGAVSRFRGRFILTIMEIMEQQAGPLQKMKAGSPLITQVSGRAEPQLGLAEASAPSWSSAFPGRVSHQAPGQFGNRGRDGIDRGKGRMVTPYKPLQQHRARETR
jgi:hypothetical protein